mmetsp:Transcript_24751/g.62835  ORF Transcript_24751/g.62835 Transcript_24751/m.62835 type:complete len:1266 (-) Transcript_24751:519-4316(-)
MSAMRGFGASQVPAGTKGKVVLSDRYMLGEELGRGAYGQVYKGIDMTSGDTVAIKQISLAGISQDNLQSVMGEIELLKTLNHKNIVKYIGSFKTRTHLYIILEYMENGALSAIIKPSRFGVLSETLVAVYIGQVLQGLQYLHDQGVVHRDIKGANILTTKEGLVKLADFGVAAKLGELEERRDELQQHVVGTPYWMAPEVIEMTQVTSASDIWSVGCLIVELLTGSPPYYDLQPMSALFRIVQDSYPPLPEHITPLMRDFLMQCFHKDPRMRPDARALLQHEWLQVNRRTIRNSWRGGVAALTAGRGRGTAEAHESVTSVIARMVAAEEGDEEAGTSGSAAAAAGMSTPIGAHNVQLSMANDGSPSPNLPTPPTHLGKNFAPSPLRDGALAPAMTAAAAAAASTPPPPQQPQPEASSSQPAQTAVPLPPLPPSQLGWGGAPAPVSGAPSGRQMGPLSDFISRLQGEAGIAGGSAGPRAQLDSWLQGASAVQGTGSMDDSMRGGAGLFAPQASMSRDAASAGAGDPLGLGLASTSSTAMEQRKKMATLLRVVRPPPGVVKEAAAPSTQAQSACREVMLMLIKLPETKQYFLSESGVLVLLEMLESDNAKYGELALELIALLTHGDDRLLESLCLVGMVPAACRYTLPPFPASVRMRAAQFAAQLVFLSESTLHIFVACQGLRHIVAMVADTTSPSVAAQQQQQQAADSPGLAITQIGMTCIWRLLESYGSLPLNYLCRILAQAGLVPRIFVVLKQTITQLNKIKREGAQAGQAGLGGRLPSAQQARSLPAAAAAGEAAAAAAVSAAAAANANPYSTLDPRLFKSAAMMGVKGSPSSLTADPRALRAALQAGSDSDTTTPIVIPYPTNIPYFPPGALPQDALEQLQDQAVTLLLVLSHGDTAIKQFMATKDNLQQHIDCITRIGHPPHLIKALRALRWLTCEHTLLPAIKDAGAISTLVPYLSKETADMGPGTTGHEVQLEALQALYNICKFNKKVHLEAAANVNAIAHLVHFAQKGIEATAAVAAASAAAVDTSTPGPSSSAQTPAGASLSGTGAAAAAASPAAAAAARWASIRGYVVPMLVGMVSCSASTRAKLWAVGGLDLFLQLLAQPDSQVQQGVLQALDVWLAEDHSRVEAKLTQRDAVGALVGLAARTAQAGDTTSAPQLLDTLRQMIGRSPKLAVALSVGGLVGWLMAMIEPAAPILRVKLLEIIRCLYEHHPRPKDFLLEHHIPALLRSLLGAGGRGTDAVHQEAQRLLTAFQINVLF